MADEPKSSIILYQTEDGRTRIECRFENETIWLTQALIAELFQTSIPNVNIHLKAIYEEGELDPRSTIKSYLIVRTEGGRSVSRDVLHYSLSAILAVGYRVRSHRGTQFRQWATARLSEYLVKGFVMDDERLKNPPGPGVPDYFDELLEVIDCTACAARYHRGTATAVRTIPTGRSRMTRHRHILLLIALLLSILLSAIRASASYREMSLPEADRRVRSGCRRNRRG